MNEETYGNPHVLPYTKIHFEKICKYENISNFSHRNIKNSKLNIQSTISILYNVYSALILLYLQLKSNRRYLKI